MSGDELKALVSELADQIGGQAFVAVPPIMVNTKQAATMLGMSPKVFGREVAPYVKALRRGEAGPGKGRALRLYYVEDLQRWARENSERITE